MDNSEHKFKKFEQELSKGINEAAVDYQAVESKLFDRICQSADLGELCVLKADIIKPAEFFGDIEKTLTQNIAQYREYVEPIDECINHEVDLTGAQWERLESKLNECIYAVHDLPLWELSLKVPQACSEQMWDKVEEQLFDRIDSLKKSDKWEEYAKSDEVAIPVDVERVEQQLVQRIEMQPVNAWEQVLKTEEILPYKKWEECEDALFEKIENQNNLGKMPFWFIVEGYVNTLKKYSAVAVSLLLILVGTVVYIKVNKAPEQVASIVYQLQGEAVLHSELASEQQNAFHSVNGGSVTFVNTHGVVTMKNESVVALEQISSRDVRYKVGFKEKPVFGHDASADVSFYVHKKSIPDAFKVETPDYQIIVKGTYFKVEPDISGRVSTRVLEGVVKIHSNDFGDTLLYAGQSLMYDMFSNRYKIHSSGPVIARSEIEKLPEMVDLVKYGIVKVVSPEIDAEVSIDGKVYGSAPIAVRQPFGLHRVIVKKVGFAGVDTTIDLEQEAGAIEVSAVLQKIEKPVIAPAKAPSIKAQDEKPMVQPKKDTVNISPEIVAEKMLGADPEIAKAAEQNYFAAQKAELAGKWNEAVARYQDVFNSEGSSRLRKEDALFSIGKIRAEHEKEPSEGKQVFLKYLALFPDGSFSGECWLRLAELEFRSNPDNAIQYYTRFFEMFPMHPRLAELKNRVGVIYLQRKRYRDAISMFRNALSNCGMSQDAERVRITSNLQKALEESGDSDSADLLRKELHAESR